MKQDVLVSKVNIDVSSNVHRTNEVFFGRDKELNDIVNMIVGQNKKVILITGGEKIGKTSFLRELMKGRLQDIGTPILCEIQKIKSNINMIYDLSYHVGKSIVVNEQFVQFYNLFHNGSGLWTNRLATLVDQCAKLVKPGKLLILLDDYHYLNDVLLAGKLTVSSLEWAENLMDLPVVFILTGNKTVKNCLGKTFSSDYWEKEIGVLSEKGAWDMIVKTTVSSISFKNTSAILSIYRLSGGHPLYLQYILQELMDYIDSFKHRSEIDENDIEKIAERITEYPSEHIKNTWEKFGWKERVALTVLANSLNDSKSYANIIGIMKTAERGGFPLTPTEYKESLRVLEDSYLIDRKQNTEVARFHIDIFRKWIVRYYNTCNDLDRRKNVRTADEYRTWNLPWKWKAIGIGLILIISAAIYPFVYHSKVYKTAADDQPAVSVSAKESQAPPAQNNPTTETNNPKLLASVTTDPLIGQKVRIKPDIPIPCEGWGYLRPNSPMVVLETKYLGKYLKVGESTDMWGIVCPEDIEIIK